MFFHDRCFDGAASAALFSRFYRERVAADASFEYTGLVHRAGVLFDESQFDAEQNAIVDFKYSSSTRITWWFDHHQSAFLTPADAAHFRQQADPHKFYDPEYKSCTKLIVDVAEKNFGFSAKPVAELVKWADIVDGAQFPDPQTAVEMREPALKLTMVIEANQDAEFSSQLIPLLAVKPLGEIIAERFVAERIPPLMQRHQRSIELLRQRAEFKQGTVFFDISDQQIEGYNKFIPYYLFPPSIYSVGLSRSSFRNKVSVGSNPWASTEGMVNLAAICERYGGGGHARVGAISFAPEQAERAHQAAVEIAAELRATRPNS